MSDTKVVLLLGLKGQTIYQVYWNKGDLEETINKGISSYPAVIAVKVFSSNFSDKAINGHEFHTGASRGKAKVSVQFSEDVRSSEDAKAILKTICKKFNGLKK